MDPHPQGWEKSHWTLNQHQIQGYRTQYNLKISRESTTTKITIHPYPNLQQKCYTTNTIMIPNKITSRHHQPCMQPPTSSHHIQPQNNPINLWGKYHWQKRDQDIITYHPHHNHAICEIETIPQVQGHAETWKFKSVGGSNMKAVSINGASMENSLLKKL